MMCPTLPNQEIQYNIQYKGKKCKINFIFYLWLERGFPENYCTKRNDSSFS